MEYEGRRYRVDQMAGHRISRVVVEDIAAPQEAPLNKSNNTAATQ
jgi:hypothetical protein